MSDRKLIFFDIDNTLFCHKEGMSFIPEQTKKAVSMLRKNGHIVAIATGRSRHLCQRCCDLLEMPCDGVFNNGAQVVFTDKMIENKLSKELSTDIYNYIKNDDVYIFGAHEDYIFEHGVSEATYSYVREESGLWGVMKPFPDDSNIPALFSLTVYGVSGNWHGQKKTMLEFPQIYFCDGYADIVKKGISKGKGIEICANYFGFDINDVIAVGDGINDIEMIRKAGLGIAVGNACDELKTVADMVTDDITRDGIYKVFKKLELI